VSGLKCCGNDKNKSPAMFPEVEKYGGRFCYISFIGIRTQRSAKKKDDLDRAHRPDSIRRQRVGRLPPYIGAMVLPLHTDIPVAAGVRHVQHDTRADAKAMPPSLRNFFGNEGSRGQCDSHYFARYMHHPSLSENVPLLDVKLFIVPVNSITELPL